MFVNISILKSPIIRVGQFVSVFFIIVFKNRNKIIGLHFCNEFVKYLNCYMT